MDLHQISAQRQTLSQSQTHSLEILEMTQLALAAWIEEAAEKNPVLKIRLTFPSLPLQDPATKPSLYEHLLAQIRDAFPLPHQRCTASNILQHLDEKGFLSSDFTPSEAMIPYIQIMQTFDPPGIFAANLQESFLIQLRHRKLAHTLIFQIVSKSFNDLLHGRYHQIQKRHRINTAELTAAIQVLSRLSTRPASEFDSGTTQFTRPDLRLLHLGNSWTVEWIDDYLPTIDLEESYLNYKELKDFILSAKWLIRSIQKRKIFLLKLSSYLVQKQHAYLNQEGPLIPISISELALKFSVHESTIYRALADKTLDTPHGTYLLAHLAPTTANTRAKELLQKLIFSEDRLRPLSDEQLTALMKQSGFPIARRTIAKYRKQLQIHPSSTRKHLPPKGPT